MDADPARDRLEVEREQLERMRSGYDDEPRTTETFNRARDLTVLEQIDAELADVEHALSRLDDGTYGTCEACGRPISTDRLEAMPATRFCVEDQARAEQG